MNREEIIQTIKSNVRNINDFPKKGIIFRDITPILGNADLFKKSLDLMLEGYDRSNVDVIAGVDSRGFIFGAVAAARLGLPFVPIRKKNKLPWKTFEEAYELEYSTNVLAIHQDACMPNQRVLLVDDLLATGGTANASAKLIHRCQAKLVACTFLIELVDLSGRDKLKDIPVHSLVRF